MSIIDELRRQKLRSLQASISYNERKDEKVSNDAKLATSILTGEKPAIYATSLEEYIARETYYNVKQEYERKTSFNSAEPLCPRSKALWSRVVKACKTSGVDIEPFVRAQFTYFHTTFKKAPTVVQLTTDEAIVRAATVAPKKVITNNIEADIDTVELFKSCERQMGNLMRSQGLTREEVYRKLVVPGLVMFPAKYLNSDPVWKSVNV